ncbi:MAG TPA: putative metalloprotease CJM1_0395 family protein [Gammaproteobacteria bacterium]|nr:putative metalloprotease CJM1_0395 family protein [Gammaproteobacteria bacterium]
MELPSYQPNWRRPAAVPGAGSATPSSSTQTGEAQKDQTQKTNGPAGGETAKRSGEAGAKDKAEGPSGENQQMRKLKTRDREVRMHEQAHLAAGGKHTQGGANFQYQRGPDGQLYAVGGEVQIDTAKVPGDPQATLEKAETIRRAALAPAEPSAQDMQVAAKARAMAAEARAELRQSEDGDKSAATDKGSGGMRIESREEAAYLQSMAAEPAMGTVLSRRV